MKIASPFSRALLPSDLEKMRFAEAQLLRELAPKLIDSPSFFTQDSFFLFIGSESFSFKLPPLAS